jgi:hypothetical protein
MGTKRIAMLFRRANSVAVQIPTKKSCAKSDRLLEKNDEGYQEISKILINYLFDFENFSPLARTKDVRIYRIYDSGMMEIGTDTAGGQSYKRPFYFSVVSTNMTFVGDNPPAGGPTNFICDLDRIKEPIEQLKNPNILIFCFGMFFLGTLVEIAAFFIESKEPHNPIGQHVNEVKKEAADSSSKADGEARPAPTKEENHPPSP